jgi:hypothetical protein
MKLPLDLRAAALGLACCAISGCGIPAGPPPVIDFGARVCADHPDLSTATVVAYTPDDPKPVTVSLDGTAPCFKSAGGAASAYVVFALPDTDSEHIVSISSAPVGNGLFPPYATFLDASGSSVRSVPASAFLFRGEVLNAQVRSHPGEKYLLVQSVPELIGKGLTRTEAITSAYGAVAGGAYFTIYTGSDVTTNFTYSLNGQITVELRPFPKS